MGPTCPTMKILRALLSLSALLLAVRIFAQAPDSLAGKTIHERFFVSPGRTTLATIVQLKADGTCSFIRFASGSLLNLQATGVVFTTTPPADTTWSYARTGPATGLLVIDNEVPGLIIQKTLTFTSPASGPIALQNGLGSGAFLLTDKPTADAAPLSNVSLRGRVEPGRPLIAGFVAPGTERHDVLIRVVGPSLSQFGLTGTWADPDFSVVPAQPDTSQESFFPDAYYADWSAPSRQTPDPSRPQTNLTNPADGFKKIFNYVGAFPLLASSKDAVQIMNVGSGAYTVVCIAPAGDPGGDVLIEIYFLP